MPVGGDGGGDGVRELFGELVVEEVWAEVEESWEFRGEGRGLEEDAAVLEDCAESSALGAADNFGTLDVDDVIGIAAEEAEEVFRGSLGGGWLRKCGGAGLSDGIAAELAGSIALMEEQNEGGVYGCVKAGRVVAGGV